MSEAFSAALAARGSGGAQLETSRAATNARLAAPFSRPSAARRLPSTAAPATPLVLWAADAVPRRFSFVRLFRREPSPTLFHRCLALHIRGADPA
jgi:hypothetical protein